MACTFPATGGRTDGVPWWVFRCCLTRLVGGAHEPGSVVCARLSRLSEVTLAWDAIVAWWANVASDFFRRLARQRN